MADDNPASVPQGDVRIVFSDMEHLLVDKEMIVKNSGWFRREIEAIDAPKHGAVTFQLMLDGTKDIPMLQLQVY